MDDLVTRIDYINDVMMHNFGVISDLNIHSLTDERTYQDCVTAKKHGIAYKVAAVVLETIIITLYLTVLVILITLYAALLFFPLILLALICWPATVAIIGACAAIYLMCKVNEGLKIYTSQKPYYLPPIKKYEKMRLRNRKPLGARLTDFFRGK